MAMTATAAEAVLVLPCRTVAAGAVPSKPYAYPRAWTGATLRREDWHFELPPACLAELDAVARSLRADPLPTLVLTPELFALDACRAYMARVKRALDGGPGLAVVHRLPVERLAQEEARALYWLLGSLLGRPVAQSWKGIMSYDVTDTGKVAGNGVRASITSAELNFHTDNASSRTPPQYIGLLCWHGAREGGRSRLLSWYAVYNELLRTCPEPIPRGFAPFLFDRQMEHAEGAPRVLSRPLFELDDDALVVRYFRILSHAGYRMAGRTLDAEGAALLAAIEAILEREGFRYDLDFQPGQIQFVNNAVIGHARTAFVDHPEPDRRRLLVRMWFRERGRISFDG
jgi:hypothetical protein